MKRKTSAFGYLYREHTIYNLLFTAASADLLLRYGAISHVFIFWVKVVGFAGITLAYYWSRKKHRYFFHNLGFTTRSLLVSSFVMDTTVSLIILSVVNLIAY
ncbi:MAG: hypothetical protein WA960_16150 [Tunicatimonas sp.]